MIEELKKALDYPLKIVVGGYAFQEDIEKFKLVNADYFACTYEDILIIAKGEVEG